VTVDNATARKLLASEMSENEFQGWVVTTARLLGWRAFHPYDSRRSEAGFPDTTLTRGGRLIFAELKTMKGKVTAAQQEWLDAFNEVDGIEVFVWRPDQLDEILGILA
jgi:hypothetical protein